MAVSDRIAVMNQGSVVQEGSAEDLYHRPASEFVARFVGRVNLVPGKVLRRDVNVAEVAALGTTFRLAEAPPAAITGETVRLIVRPEAIHVNAGTMPSSSIASALATVRSRVFLGEKVEYVLDCQGETLQAVRASAGPRESIADGAGVTLTFAEESVTLLGAAP